MLRLFLCLATETTVHAARRAPDFVAPTLVALFELLGARDDLGPEVETLSRISELISSAELSDLDIFLVAHGAAFLIACAKKATERG